MVAQKLSELRRTLAAGAAEQFYSNLAYWGSKHPKADPKRHGLEVLRDIPYILSDAAHHRLDVYRPTKRDSLLPVVMYIHGGGFRILSKDTHWIFGIGFARKGYAVFNLNYRLAPNHAFPAAAIDVCKAYEWIVNNAERFGGDPSRIIIAGESAGANLCAMVAIAACCERPEPWAKALLQLPAPIAVMPSCGLHQVSDARRFGRRRKLPRFITDQLETIAIDYLGETQGEHAMADPLLVLEEGVEVHRPMPPFLLTVGTRDPILDDTRRLDAALRAMGVACETHYYEGEGHAFQALVWREKAKTWWGDSLRFMKRAVDHSDANRES